ncbi:tRNA-dihydrouridine synthase B [Listeria monocytogenes]|nr:tRNA-dihydrouridine synthase B [Listeria monocytogenes]
MIILFTGQPILISIISAVVFSATNFAASTSVSFSPPKICKLNGFSFSSIYSISSVLALRYAIPLSLIISQQTRPAPNSLTVKRNAELDIPAIGATTTWFLISTLPILNINGKPLPLKLR